MDEVVGRCGLPGIAVGVFQDGEVRQVEAKVDPQADFSYDYEDLAFMHVGGCGQEKGLNTQAE